jgi:Glycosyltransferase
MVIGDAEVVVILGNSNSRFSGVTSTMLQTMSVQKELIPLKVLGKYHMPDTSLSMSFFQAVRLLRTPLRGGRPRVFHARRNDEMIQALLLKYLFGCPLKIIFTSTAQRHHSRFSRWLMAKMDVIVSTCNAAAFYLRVKPQAIVPHGIDPDVYQPRHNKREILNSIGVSTPKCIGIFGRVRAQKGVDLFVEACLQVLPALPDYSAVIVGAGEVREREWVSALESKVQAAGLSDRVLFLGEQEFEQVPIIMSAMTLIAALSRNEGFGLTVLESMSCGVPVIATEAGAWPEIVREGVDGHVIPVGDLLALEDCLNCLLPDEAKLTQMGTQARNRVLERYTVEREATRLVQIYRSVQ